MVGNVAFRSATFGGFNREDVMNYIEKSAQKNKKALETANEQTAAAQEKADELARLNEELKHQLVNQQSSVKSQLYTLQNEIQQVVTERDSLKEKVEQMDAMEQELEDTENRLLRLKSTCDQQQRELTRYETQLHERDQTIAALQAQVERMRSDSDSYHTMCDTIGQIEMDARYRTTVMEQETQRQLDEKIAQAQSTYDSILANAANDANALRREVYGQLEQTRADVISTSANVNEAISKALREVRRVQGLLQGLNGCMDGPVSAVNQLAMLPEELLPEDLMPEQPQEPSEETSQNE